jgi:hypothetical protein
MNLDHLLPLGGLECRTDRNGDSVPFGPENLVTSIVPTGQMDHPLARDDRDDERDTVLDDLMTRRLITHPPTTTVPGRVGQAD